MNMRSSLGLLIIALASPSGFSEEKNGYLLLDDFSGERSVLNTEWEGFTDRVMGGVSEMSVTRVPDRAHPFIRMQGTVSLENNGGFVQIRLKLASSLSTFDASGYQGIRLSVRGEGESYYIFLRTANTLLPWKYYAASVSVSEDWQALEIPWSAFKGGDYGRVGRLRTDRLKSVALVAYGKAFDARIDMREIGLY